MAQPRQFPDIHDAILDALYNGKGIPRAAEISGVSSALLPRWFSEGGRDHSGPFGEFAVDVRRIQAGIDAEAEYALRRHLREGNWPALAWFLERGRRPAGYGRRDAPRRASSFEELPEASRGRRRGRGREA